MSEEEKRRSDRIVPVVSEEEVVLIDLGKPTPSLAKLLDFSEVGTLVYLLVDASVDAPIGTACFLMIYQQGKVITIPAKIVRKLGRLIGFDFGEMSAEVVHDVQAKLLRMEVEWLRLSKSGSH
jgi:PilZ domain